MLQMEGNGQKIVYDVSITHLGLEDCYDNDKGVLIALTYKINIMKTIVKTGFPISSNLVIDLTISGLLQVLCT